MAISNVLKWPSGASRGIQHLLPIHERMIDWLIANPAASQVELAREFGFASRSWVCQIVASPVFQTRLAHRRTEFIEPVLRAGVEEHIEGLMRRSLVILQEKLDRPTAEVPDQLALRCFEIGARVLGFGARDEPSLNPSVVEGHLDELGKNLEGLLRRKKAAAEGITINAKTVS